MNNNKFLSFLNPRIIKHTFVKNIAEETEEPNDVTMSEYYAYLFIDLKFVQEGIFVKLTETELSTSSASNIYEWWMTIKGLRDPDAQDYIVRGINDFKPGTHYFLSNSLANAYGVENESITMDDLFGKFGDYININEYTPVADTYLDMYIRHNEIFDEYTEFSLDDLKKICVKFFEIILKYYDDFSQEVGDTTNQKYQLYQTVLNYFGQERSDDVSNIMKLVFETGYYPKDLEYKVINSNSSSVTCNCNDATAGAISGATPDANAAIYSSTTSMSCSDKYFYAMNEYLIMMLSDTDFYCWFLYKYLNNDTSDRIPNEDLIDKLIELLSKFIELGYDLSSTSQSSTHNKCGCNDCIEYGNNSATVGTTISKTNYSTIQNYIDVLESVKTGNMTVDKNKLYIYGRAFGKLLPGLCF